MRRIDDLQLKGLKLLQDDELFCFGTDSVLLADFVEVRNEDKIVDLGTGNGVIPVLLSARDRRFSITGVEIQLACARLAQENIDLNGLQEIAQIVHADFKEYNASGVTCVVCNPPYEKKGSGQVSKTDAHLIARHEVEANFSDVAAAASRLLQTGGRFYMIHRAPRLCEIITTLKGYRLEPKVIRFIQPSIDKPPSYVLIKCIKDASEYVNILPALIVYENGKYTPEMNKIYHLI